MLKHIREALFENCELHPLLQTIGRVTGLLQQNHVRPQIKIDRNSVLNFVFIRIINC